jgi:zinc transport system substrate-binding protein
MKKAIFVLTTLILSISLIACQSSEEYDIVATMYTHYNLSKEIVQDKMSVTMLVPLGEGIHGFEASSQDMVNIENAKLFLYTSEDIDTWITDASSLGGNDTIVLNMSESLDHDHEDEETSQSTVKLLADDHDHEHTSDVHYWVDPYNAIEMAEYILEAIVEIDPDHAAFYENNADNLINSIETVSTDFESYLSEFSTTPTIYIAGHNAFSALAEHFGLDMISIFNEFEPDADLTSDELVTFVDTVKTAQAEFIFIDAIEEPKAALAIQAELETQDYTLTILTLSAYQNVVQAQFDENISYVELLEQNIANLKLAIGA